MCVVFIPVTLFLFSYYFIIKISLAMLHEIKIIVDTQNNVVKAKNNNDLICSVWVYTDETKAACLLSAKEVCFNEMCKLSGEGHKLIVSENWF